MSCVQTLVLVLASFTGEPRGEVLDFSSVRCGPCQQMSPLVSKLAREGLPIRKVDVDQNPQLANQYNITSIPAFVLVIDGQEVTRTVGATTESTLRRMIAQIPVTPAVTLGESETASEERGLPRAGVDEPLAEVPGAEEPARRDLFDFFKKDDEPVQARANNDLPSAPTPTHNTPMAASTRIRVTVNGHINLGSGTVVDSRPGQTFIATCGHIFRDMNESTKVEVDIFEDGVAHTYIGTVRRFDLEADVGLIHVPTEAAVSSVRVVPPMSGPRQNDRVACIGCSGGDDPTREQLQVTAINKYQGPDNIECTGLPVQGRSGGGLFNIDGELIGICIAADPDANRGLYAHGFALHKLLDGCHLSHLYRPIVPVDAALAGDEAPATPFSVPGSGPAVGMMSPAEPVPGTPSAVVDLADGDAEVVVIIRSRANPQAPSRVVVINQASQKFFAYLNGELETPSGSLLPQGTIPTTRTIDAGQTEGQHQARRIAVDETALSIPAPSRYVRSARARLAR